MFGAPYFALATTVAAFAQVGPATLEGSVSSFEMRVPIAGASVTVLQDGELVADLVTGADGGFSTPLAAGTVTIDIWAEGFQPFSYEEVVAAGEVVVLRYRLRTFEQGILVTAQRAREEVSRTVVTMEELRNVPGALGDPVRALQTLPGVARPSAVEGDLVVRGAEGSSTSFLVDDIRVPYMFHLLVGRSIINPAVVESVEFYPGGMPPRLGDTLQSSVQVTTRKNPEHRFAGRISADVLDGSVAIRSQATESLSVIAAARYSWISSALWAWSAWNERQGNASDFINPRYVDLYGAIRWEPSDHHALSVTGFGARDAFLYRDSDQVVDLGLPYDPSMLVDSYFSRGRLQWETTTPGYSQTTSVVTGGDQQQSLLEPGLLPGWGPSEGRVRRQLYTFHHDDVWRVSDTFTIEDGVEASMVPSQAESFRASLANPNAPVPSTSETRWESATWIEAKFITGNWRVAPGVRGSAWVWNDQVDIAPEPRLTIRYDIADAISLKGFAGRFAQAPPIEAYAAGSGAADLHLQTSTQAVLGAEAELGPAWFLDASVYHTWMQNLVVQELVAEVISEGTQSVESLALHYDAVAARAFGIETLLRVHPRMAPWWGWIGATFGKALRVAENGDFYPSDRDQPFALTLLLSWDLPRAWVISGRARYTSGHPFTPFSGVFDPEQQVYRPLPGIRNSDRFPAFRQLDFRVQKTWEKPQRDWVAYLDVFNATWQKNPFVATYSYDYRDLIPVVHVPLLPILGVECHF